MWQAVLRVVSDDQLIVDTLQGSAVSATDAKEDQEIREREKEAKELMHRLENLYDFAETGDISREVFRERKAKIDERLAATQDVLRKIADRKAEQQRALENLAGVIELCEQVRERLPLIPEEERRAFDLAIGLRVLLGPDGASVGQDWRQEIDERQPYDHAVKRVQLSKSISGCAPFCPGTSRDRWS